MQDIEFVPPDAQVKVGPKAGTIDHVTIHPGQDGRLIVTE